MNQDKKIYSLAVFTEHAIVSKLVFLFNEVHVLRQTNILCGYLRAYYKVCSLASSYRECCF